MTPEQAKQPIFPKGQAVAQWASSSAAACPPAPFNAIEVAQAELHYAYRDRMAVVMARLVAVDSAEEHRVWLAEVERCLVQFHLASAWIAQQTAAASPQLVQSSAA